MGLRRAMQCGKEKREYIATHGLVVWRFHDHWHMRRPDGILLGMVKAMGWEKYQSKENAHLFLLPEISVKTLAAEAARESWILRWCAWWEIRR